MRSSAAPGSKHLLEQQRRAHGEAWGRSTSRCRPSRRRDTWCRRDRPPRGAGTRRSASSGGSARAACAARPSAARWCPRCRSAGRRRSARPRQMTASSSSSLTPCSCASSCPQVSTPPRGASMPMHATRRSCGRSRQRSRPGAPRAIAGYSASRSSRKPVLLEARLHQQQRRVAVPEHVLELGPGREGVHGNQHAAQHAHREGGHDPLGAIAHVHGDAGALHDACPDQRSRQQARLALELAVAERAALEHDRAPRSRSGARPPPGSGRRSGADRSRPWVA